MAGYRSAYAPGGHAEPLVSAAATTDAAAPANGDSPAAAPVAPAAPAAPPTLSDVPAEGSGDVDPSTKTVTVVEPATSSTGSSGASLGVEVLTPGAAVPAPTGTPASTLPAATGAQDPNYGLPAPTAKNAPLPPLEKAAAAPDQVNEAAGKPEPAAQVADPNAKKKKKLKTGKVDKNDESSSKEKPKKGLDKLNPF
jgi:outer membrane protein assembly factor BamD